MLTDQKPPKGTAMATKKELPAFMMKGKPGDKKPAAGKKGPPMMAPPFGKKPPAKKK
jgi:hypothetical protein